MIRALPAPLTIPRPAFGLFIFAMVASLSVAHLVAYQGRPWALVALLAVPIGGAFVTRRPAMTAAAIIGGSLILMWGYAGIGYADQTDLGRAALRSVLAGQTPYQFHDLGTHTNPFTYGPAAMLTAWVGPRLELASALVLLGVLARAGAWLTLGLLAAFPPFVHLTLTGINDYTPTLLLVSGLLLLRTHPRLGMVGLALAAAVKPYALAWFLPAIGFAGWSWWLIGVSAVAWSPLLWWGPASFIESVRWVSGGIGTPLMRYLAVPIGVVGLFARSWTVALLLGVATFVTVMFFGSWASLGYWIVLIPVVGIGLESSDGVRPDRVVLGGIGRGGP